MATIFSNQISVVSGGIACIVGALVLARLLPEFRAASIDATVLAVDEV